MKEKILKILSGTNEYVSGEALSKELGVSRTAIWKVINRLKEEGYDISSVRNKGYLIKKETTELVEDAIRMHLPKNSRFHQIKVYDTVDSTNSEAKRLWQNGLMEESIILAREQTAGKGRRGKSWLSPKDQGIFMSLLLMPDIEPMHASMITLIAGIAVVKAIEKTTGLSAMIKWPNDVVIGGKKVCGILTEMSVEVDYIHHVVVGIGINVNQESFDDEIAAMATSIRVCYGETISRPVVIGEIIEVFERLYARFQATKNLSFTIDTYNKYCVNIGRKLKVISRKGALEGTGMAVLSDGTLQIRLMDGTITSVNAGEVSVRGLYGYL